MDPRDPVAHGRLAEAQAELGQWPAAQKSYAAALVLAPNDADLWYCRAVSHLAAGDRATFLAQCKAMVARFGSTGSTADAANVLYACLPVAGAGGDPKLLLKLAGVLPSGSFGGRRTRGAALYRLGKDQQALEQFVLLEALGWPQRAWDWCFRAMANHRLGNDEEARECLRRAAAWIDSADRSDPSVWVRWRERHEVQALREEAERLLGQAEPARAPK
jgi:tetratricopeptide (TPR) repeat protein